MPYLQFISDEDLIKHTTSLVNAALAGEQKVEKNPYKNVIDPFSALVDAARQKILLSEWMDQEKSRQIQKSFQNAVGDFHQHILGSMPGWFDAGEGGNYDVISENKKIIAEVKNKYNTMNSGLQVQVYDKMAHWLDYGKSGFTAYVVDIVPKSPKPYCIPYTPSERGVKRQTRNNLLRIDGRSFYALASGIEDALDQLYLVLPAILEKILELSKGSLATTAEFRQLFEKAYLKK